jgi:hypothetical protein
MLSWWADILIKELLPMMLGKDPELLIFMFELLILID